MWILFVVVSKNYDPDRVGWIFCCSGLVRSAIFGLGFVLENFPYKSQFVHFFLIGSGQKVPGSKMDQPLIYCGSKVCPARVRSGPISICWVTPFLNRTFEICFLVIHKTHLEALLSNIWFLSKLIPHCAFLDNYKRYSLYTVQIFHTKLKGKRKTL